MGLLNCGATEINGVNTTEVDEGTVFNISTKAILLNQADVSRTFNVTLFVGDQAIVQDSFDLAPGEDIGPRLSGEAGPFSAGDYPIVMEDNFGAVESCQTLNVQSTGGGGNGGDGGDGGGNGGGDNGTVVPQPQSDLGMLLLLGGVAAGGYWVATRR